MIEGLVNSMVNDTVNGYKRNTDGWVRLGKIDVEIGRDVVLRLVNTHLTHSFNKNHI